MSSSWILIAIIIQSQLLEILSQPQCDEDLRGYAGDGYWTTCTFNYKYEGANGAAEGITITEGPGTTIVDNKWRIQPTTQEGADLTVDFSASWGIPTDVVSVYEITFAGSTSANTATSSTGTVIFIFSAGDQYFAETISLGSIQPRYRECPPTNSSLITRNISEMINTDGSDRYDRFCEVQDSWTETNDRYRRAVDCEISIYTDCTENTWYQGFRFTNDPINDTAIYEWYDYHDIRNLQGSYVRSDFRESFAATGQGWKLYIAGTDVNDEFTIDEISFWCQRQTDTPTKYPTPDPTMEPITSPTEYPTLYPTPDLPISQTAPSDDFTPQPIKSYGYRTGWRYLVFIITIICLW